MWQSDDSRNPDREILAAARPCLATTGGPLFAIGSPHARKGETYNTYNKHYGPNGNPAILVANGPTKLFNPTIKQSVIDRAYEDDPAVAASEWGGQFRSDLETYVNPEIVDACTVRGVYRLNPIKGISYIAHADPSGGSQDSFTLAIGHVDGDVGVLDVLLEKRPPFISIDDVVSEFCAVLKEYNIFECVGDRYAAGFTVEAFRKHGVEYRHSDMTTSDYFSGFLPILNSRRAQLLDHKRLVAQLCSLERRPSRVGAKDQVCHPFGGHDDCAAAVAGLMVRLVGTRDYKIKSFHVPALGPPRSEWIAEFGFGGSRALGCPLVWLMGWVARLTSRGDGSDDGDRNIMENITMNIDPVHLAFRCTAEGTQKVLNELEVELAEAKVRRDKIVADIGKAQAAAEKGDKRQLFVLGSLNKQDQAQGRLVLSIERQVAEAKKRLDMAANQAEAVALKQAQSDVVFGDRLFEVEAPDGRKLRHRYASPDGLQKMLQPGYKVVAEVFNAGIDGKGGMVEPLGQSTMKTLLAVHGDELIAFLAERGIIGGENARRRENSPGPAA
jgi:hypothetical protein